jgi:type IV pilus assembly protein PilA
MKPPMPGFILIDLMTTVVILGILAAIAVPAYQGYQYRAQITEALTLTDPIRDRLARYYDYHGAFPPDNAAAGLPMPDQLRGRYVQAVQVEGGALQVRIQIGETVGGLTLRPAVLAQHPYGAVHWLCGHAVPKVNFITWGENRTDIAPRYLAQVCR